MNADINSKEGSYTAETIRYDDSQLQTILDDLDEIICLLMMYHWKLIILNTMIINGKEKVKSSI